MGTFSIPAGIRIKDEFRVEKRVEDAINGVMYESVTYACLMDVPRLRIGNLECLILTMLIGFFDEVAMKGENIVCQLDRKESYILAMRFVPDEFLPGSEQIFDGNDRIEYMISSRPALGSHSSSILNRVKEGYLMWVNISPHIPKGARYTIGSRIENKFLDLLESSYTTYFTDKEQKVEKIDECILILDTLKFLVSVSWEGKFVSNKQFEDVSLKLVEIGKMFGGWRKSLDNQEKKNRDQ